jgi:hypothetical protein
MAADVTEEDREAHSYLVIIDNWHCSHINRMVDADWEIRSNLVHPDSQPQESIELLHTSPEDTPVTVSNETEGTTCGTVATPTCSIFVEGESIILVESTMTPVSFCEAISNPESAQVAQRR